MDKPASYWVSWTGDWRLLTRDSPGSHRQGGGLQASGGAKEPDIWSTLFFPLHFPDFLCHPARKKTLELRGQMEASPGMHIVGVNKTLVAGTQWVLTLGGQQVNSGASVCHGRPGKVVGPTKETPIPGPALNKNEGTFSDPEWHVTWVSSLVVTMVPAPTGRSHSIVSMAPGDWRLSPILWMGSLEVQ